MSKYIFLWERKYNLKNEFLSFHSPSDYLNFVISQDKSKRSENEIEPVFGDVVRTS